MNETLPHRFRESSFREYEPFINSIIERWPEVYRIHPSHYKKAQTTLACRLRDAMRSLSTNRWTASLDIDKFNEVYPLIVVSERTDGSILCGTKEGIALFTHGEHIPSSREIPLNVDSSILVNLSEPSKVVLAKLSAVRKIAPRLRITGVSDLEVSELQQNYDIAIDKNDDGSYTLI